MITVPPPSSSSLPLTDSAITSLPSLISHHRPSSVELNQLHAAMDGPPIRSSLLTETQSEHHVTSMTQDIETICWGCGLRLILPSDAPVFKCGWCGAITSRNPSQRDNKSFHWIRLRDRAFVYMVVIFMVCVICSFFCGVFHCVLAFILFIVTLSMFLLAAFTNPGNPSAVVWGSYPVIGRHDLDNYKFCNFCKKPKPPRAHHCRSCGMCVLDMDHHCPFIGNCVGAGNHHYFINFLLSAIASMVYVTILSAFSGVHVLPASSYRRLDRSLGSQNGVGVVGTLQAIVSSGLFLSPRGIVLIYLFMASLSVEIGLVVLLWQQLCFIYQGKTYVGNLSSQKKDGSGGEKDCQNLYRLPAGGATGSRG
ncbi:S-acyltransferase 11-like protein, partial [Drosera capensis]